MVRVEGLEPPRLAAPEPKSGASTNFATLRTQSKMGSKPYLPALISKNLKEDARGK